jgi:hypothetical protein
MNKLAILVALMLSGTAAYFSVLGLTAIFPASYWAIVGMASILELAKVVTVVWLHLHWNRVNGFIKLYLSIAIITLMGITSMGVFGFLSKAHIEQQVKISSGVGQQLKLVQLQIDTLKPEIAQLNTELEGIDKSINKITDLSKTAREARTAVNEKTKSKKDRAQLLTDRTTKQTELSRLETEKVKLEGQREIEMAEVGPIRYITGIFIDNPTETQLEKAVSWLIVILVLVFDPLAIMLLLGASTLFQKDPPKAEKIPMVAQRAKPPDKRPRKGFVEIPDDDIYKL